MAVNNATITDVQGDGSVLNIQWLLLLNGDSGSPAGLPSFADRTVHIDGTFGAGGTVVLEGSNNSGASWMTLTDTLGAAISRTAESLKTITEAPALIRPRVTAGDGTTSINVRLVVRRATPLRT
jgi:hypothetical protein